MTILDELQSQLRSCNTPHERNGQVVSVIGENIDMTPDVLNWIKNAAKKKSIFWWTTHSGGAIALIMSDKLDSLPLKFDEYKPIVKRVRELNSRLQ
jgi:hypothetical protein